MIARVMIDVLTGKTITFSDSDDTTVAEYTAAGYTLYDPKKKFIYGSQVNFLSDIKAAPADISYAIDEVCTWFASMLMANGLAVVSTDREKANGTIVLQQITTIRRLKNSPNKRFYEVYKIYANGQIRQGFGNHGTIYGPASHYRMTSPMPTMYSDNNPRSSLINTYEDAIFAVIQKYNNKQARKLKNT